MSEYNPGDRVRHEEYGEGTVKQHPDAPGENYPNDPRNDTHIYFDETPETTIVRVRETRLEKITDE